MQWRLWRLITQVKQWMLLIGKEKQKVGKDLYRRPCLDTNSLSLLLGITSLRSGNNHIWIQQESWASTDALFFFFYFLPWKLFLFSQRLADSVLFFLCFCLTSHRLLPRLAVSRVDFFSLWCLSVVWHPWPDKETRRGEEKTFGWGEKREGEKTEMQQGSKAKHSASLCFQHTALGTQLCTLNTTKSD